MASRCCKDKKHLIAITNPNHKNKVVIPGSFNVTHMAIISSLRRAIRGNS